MGHLYKLNIDIKENEASLFVLMQTNLQDALLSKNE